MKFYIALLIGFLISIVIMVSFGMSFYGAEHHDKLTDDVSFNIGLFALAAFACVFYASGRHDEASR